MAREEFIEALLKMGATEEQADTLYWIANTREGFPTPLESMVDLVRRSQFDAFDYGVRCNECCAEALLDSSDEGE